MATLTLRNVPDALYESLKARAARNRRSLNQEAIAQLETTLNVRSPEESRLAFERASEFRERAGFWIDHNGLDALINEGRM